ncbi:MAG: winged helix DNA-binding domain-containing protein [Myxococcota bacterium]|nr:winged helix DNA-binding domain-containing protein [Myxococcota bacterium]
MKDEAIAQLRLRRQHLTGAPLPTPEAVVGWLGAVQAQEFALAKWSVAQRCRGQVTSAHLDRALAEGRILRTHAMRSTWHFVLPADLRWLLRLIGPRMRARVTSYCARYGMNDAVFKKSQALLREALSGGRQLVSSEVAEVFARGRVRAEGLKLRFLLLQAELDLVVCSGALRGKQQTVALVDELVPSAPPMPEDQALSELARRYFSSHGPATLKDFVWWSSLSAAQARRGLELLKEKGLRQLRGRDRTYWVHEGARRRAVSETPVRLLQPYDEYVIGYTESRSVLAIAGRPAAPTALPTHSNTLIRDGQVLGYWRMVPSPKRALIHLHLARPLDASARSELEDELARYSGFLQLPVHLATTNVGRPRAGVRSA